MRVHNKNGTKERLFEMFKGVAKVNLREDYNPETDGEYGWGNEVKRMLDYAKANNIKLDVPSNMNGLDYSSMELYIEKAAKEGKIAGEVPTDQEIAQLVDGYNSYESAQGEKAFDNFSSDYFGGSSPVTDTEKYQALAQQKREIGENGYDYHAAEMDHLGQQDLAADQAEHPEHHDNVPVMDNPSKRDFDDKEQVSIK